MATDEYEAGESIRSLDHNKSVKARNGWSVVDKRDGSCKVVIASGTLGTGNGALEVTAGTAITSGTTTNVATQAVDIDEGDPDDPRKDVVSIDAAGAAQVHKGVAKPQDPTTVSLENAEQPAPKSLKGVDAVPLSMVTVPAGATTITSGNLADKRERADREFGHVRSQSSTTEHTTLTDEQVIYAYSANGNHVEPFDVSDYANGGAAIQAAIDALPAFQTGDENALRGEIFIPRGVYNVTSPIQLTGRIKIRGAGQKVTTLFVPNGSDTNVFEWIPDTASNEHFCKISDLLVSGNGLNQTSGKGIVLDDTNGGRPSELFLVDVYIREMADHGAVFSGSWSCRIERCTIETNGKANDRDNIFINTSNNENLHVANCFLAYATRYAVYAGGDEATFRNNWFYQSDANGVNVPGNRNHFVGNRVFGNSQGTSNTYAGVRVDGNDNAFAANYYDGDKSGVSAVESHAIDVRSGATDNQFVPAYVNTGSYGTDEYTDAGTRTRLNGVGSESASAETPTAANWNVGDVVDFTDSGDGSGNGVYLLLPDETWSQVGST